MKKRITNHGLEVTLHQALWEELFASVERAVGGKESELWLRRLRLISAEKETLVIGAPSALVASLVERKFGAEFQRAAAAQLGAGWQVRFAVDPRMWMDALRAGSSAAAAHAAPAAATPVTLDSFVVDDGNRLAWEACRHVARHGGSLYSPLVLYGAPATGKTHLMQALAAAMPGRRVRAYAYPDFLRAYQDAVRRRALTEFRAQVRALDLLGIDEFQPAPTHRGMLEELLHTVDELRRREAAIVFAMPAHPSRAVGIDSTLVNRLLSGLVVELNAPARESRRVILAARAASRQFRLPEPLLEQLSDPEFGGLREAFGVLHRVEAYARLAGGIPDSAASELLPAVSSREIRLPDIAAIVCRELRVSLDELLSSRKSARIARARRLAMYLARQLTRLSYAEIGAYFGGRTHSTAIAAVAAVAGQCRENPAVDAVAAALMKALRDERRDSTGGTSCIGSAGRVE